MMTASKTDRPPHAHTQKPRGGSWYQMMRLACRGPATQLANSANNHIQMVK